MTIAASGGSGTGHEPGKLGLMIAQRLVRLMDGSFEIVTGTAELSRCRFTCRLSPARMGSRDAGTDPSASPPWARLLVVEENVINQDAARTILERVGYAVDVASDGVAAVEAVQRDGCDLVFVSVERPDMDGLATARRTRALAHPACDVPIVTMMATTLPNGMRMILEAGINGRVVMPLVRDRLLAAVDTHVSAVSLVEVPPSAPEPSLPMVFEKERYDRLVEEAGPRNQRNRCAVSSRLSPTSIPTKRRLLENPSLWWSWRADSASWILQRLTSV